MAVPNAQVRRELMERLHQANEHFQQSREEWEKWLAAPEFRHEERVDAAREKLRAAEREVEEVEERIKNALGAGTDEEN